MATTASLLFPDDPQPRVTSALIQALEGDARAASAVFESLRSTLGDEQVSTGLMMVRLFGRLGNIEAEILDQKGDMSLKSSRFLASLMPEVVRLTFAAKQKVDAPRMKAFDVPPVLARGFGGLASAMRVSIFRGQAAVLRQVESLVRINPEGTFLGYYGTLLVGAERYEEAEATLLAGAEAPSILRVERVLRLNALMIQRGFLGRREPPPGVRERTLKNIRKILGLGVLRPEFALQTAQAAAEAGDPDLARAILADLERAGPLDREAWLVRANLELECASPARAIAAADVLLKQNPADDEAKKVGDRARSVIRDQAKALP